MNRSEGIDKVFAKTTMYSGEMIIAAFDRAFTNLSSDFLAHYILKNDETFEKMIRLVFDLDKLFQNLEDRNVQGLEISQSSTQIKGKKSILRQYYYKKLNRRINIAAFKFNITIEESRLYIKELSNLDYKCELLVAIQK